jgi:hypothetical protein
MTRRPGVRPSLGLAAALTVVAACASAQHRGNDNLPATTAPSGPVPIEYQIQGGGVLMDGSYSTPSGTTGLGEQIIPESGLNFTEQVLPGTALFVSAFAQGGHGLTCTIWQGDKVIATNTVPGTSSSGSVTCDAIAGPSDGSQLPPPNAD